MTNYKVYKEKPKNKEVKLFVAAVYLECQSKLLFLQRSQRSAQALTWAVPAGKCEENEKPLFAAQRELYEETQIKAPLKSFERLGRLWISIPKLTYEYHLFYLSFDQKPTVILNHENITYSWFTKEIALKEKLMMGAFEALEFFYERVRQ